MTRLRFGLFFAMFFVCAIISAQTKPSSTPATTVIDFDAKAISLYSTTFVTPLVADIVVLTTAPQKHEVQATINIPRQMPDESSYDYTQRISPHIQSHISELKAQVIFEMCEEFNAAAIIEPIFGVSTTSSTFDRLEVSVKVIGYPAVYTNFRNATPADTAIMHVSEQIPSYTQRDMQNNSAIIPPPSRTTPKKVSDGSSQNKSATNKKKKK